MFNYISQKCLLQQNIGLAMPLTLELKSKIINCWIHVNSREKKGKMSKNLGKFREV